MAIEERNAVIESVTLGIEDHGLLSMFLRLNYGGAGQGFGGYNLYAPHSKRQTIDKSVAGHSRCLQIAGVEDVSRLKGRTIRVRADWGKIHAIGHIINDDWFNPSEDYKELQS